MTKLFILRKWKGCPLHPPTSDITSYRMQSNKKLIIQYVQVMDGVACMYKKMKTRKKKKENNLWHMHVQVASKC